MLGAAVGSGGGDEQPAAPAQAAIPEACQGAGGNAWARLAGQRIVVRTDGTPDAALLRRAREGEIAGVIVFPAVGAEQPRVADGIRALQRAAREGGQPPLVVATDQEGGPVKRFVADPPLRSPRSLGESGDPADARLQGSSTGDFLRGLGINADLAPVLDVPASAESAIFSRAFGADAERVSALGLAFADGLAQEGVLATAKHFPGFGRSVLNTDLSPSEIQASRGELREDLAPFRDAIAEKLPLIMIASASYPALGGNGPAVLEPAVVQRLLRERLGFEGVSISDDLQAGALEATYDAGEVTERAARAGVDLLLFAGDSAPEAQERLSRALGRGALDAEAARESCVRVVALRESLR